jgi:membrane protein
LVVSLVIVFCLWKGNSEGRIGICGGVISFLVFSFSSYPMQIPGFAVTFYLLLTACVVGRSKVILFLFISMMALLGTYYWKNNQYAACKDWYRSKMLYNIGAYQSAKEDYGKLYPELANRGAFLFEYGYSLHKLKEYDNSTRILEEAMAHSNDPMILNIIGKNYQALGDYEKAEEYLIRSTHRLPGRIYPYYLLVKLYAEPQYLQPEKLKYAAEIVLTKEPKVQSTAVREMREEVKKLLK